jgi:DNA-binding beta-propeller fold protein YncE
MIFFRAMKPFCLLCSFALVCFAQAPPNPPTAEEAARLTALIQGSSKLPWTSSPLAIQARTEGWNTDYISSVAAGRKGETYLIHRNLGEDAVVVIDKKGKILRSWGKGLYTIPHSIRLDPEGNVWTVDSGSSVVLKFTPQGKLLLRIEVGELPTGRRGARGTADIAFGPGGRIFIADGYGNARILEYNAAGQRVKQWGTAGTGPGQFNLPHGLVLRDGVIYVADRQNGRIQQFDLEGKYLGEWNHLGKTFSITAGPDGNLWLGTHARNVINEAPGWLVNVDRNTGKVLGYVESPGLHSVDAVRKGEVLSDPGRGNLNRVLWHRAVR